MRIQFKTGADPEVFILDRDTMTVVPAYKLTKGTKDRPTRTKRGSVLADNVMLEFNPAPQNDITATHHWVDAMMGEFSYRKNFSKRELTFLATPTTSITDVVAREAEAQVFGCDPDFCAYVPGRPRKRPTPLPLERCGAGHIHIGMDPKPDIPDHILAQLCDLTFGLAAVAGGEEQHGRRERYGVAGLYRPKPYGIEYRTLSNMWLQNYGVLAGIATAENTFRTLLTMSMSRIQKLYSVTDWTRVKAAIDNEVQEEAHALRAMAVSSIDILRKAA